MKKENSLMEMFLNSAERVNPTLINALRECLEDQEKEEMKNKKKVKK